jgi:hypothetical protein
VERFLPQAEPAPWAGKTRVRRAGQQLVVQRVVELVGRARRRDADRGEQVGAADVADEQGVAGEHAVGLSSSACSHTTMLIDSGVWPGVWRNSRTTSPRARCARRRRGACGSGTPVGGLAVADLGAGGLGQLEVAGEEVGVEVGLDDELDREAGAGGVARYSSTSRWGSTTTARPVVSSPIR